MTLNTLSNDTLISHVNNTHFLCQNSKDLYTNLLNKITSSICQDITLSYILQNPDEFIILLDNFLKDIDGRVYDKLTIHTKVKYISAIMAIWNYSPDLKEQYYNLYQNWINIHNSTKLPIKLQYLSNCPNERQAKSFVDYNDLCNIRDQLDIGSFPRLLLSVYIDIPPVRADYDYTEIIYTKDSIKPNNNYLLIDTNPCIILQTYKTSKKYKTLVTYLPPHLVYEITESLSKYPRNFLFVSTRDLLPYKKSNTFTAWADRTLKSVCNNKDISLNTLRHIYVSRKDLCLESKSGTEQYVIASSMCHSVEQQKKYMWHAWDLKLNI
jgi:hypothetical protein